MINLLTFTTLYPSSVRPNHGIFVETRLRHLLASGEVQTKVVAPVPWFPFKKAGFGKYALFASTPREELQNGIRVLHPRYPLIPKVSMSSAPFLLALAALPSLRRLQEQGYDFDVIDSHYFYPDGVAAVLLGWYLNKPVTVTARGTDINLIPSHILPRKLILWAAQRASGVISVCQSLKDSMIKLGVDRSRIVPIRNGVDLKLFRPIDRMIYREELGLNYFTLLSVGNLVEPKGHALIIQALVSMPDVELLIIGEGPECTRIESLINKLGLQKRVRLLGAIPQVKLPVYYGAVDVLVHASLREGLPNVLLESLACGTPVIATNVGGTAEVVRSAEAGLLLTERTPDSIAQAVKELRCDYPDRNATRRHAEKFSWDSATQGQLELFHRILTCN